MGKDLLTKDDSMEGGGRTNQDDRVEDTENTELKLLFLRVLCALCGYIFFFSHQPMINYHARQIKNWL